MTHTSDSMFSHILDSNEIKANIPHQFSVAILRVNMVNDTANKNNGNHIAVVVKTRTTTISVDNY